ncbi:MAG TPA: NAD(P)-dependent oxidoreductase [Ktedonobacteraceae bacterium]|nr:NAD(P)-dependent oxidoreductase [Ktedonobacteraceae bacterium]
MKIALFGATGMIGQRVAREALERGHDVTAIARHPEKINITHPHLTTLALDSREQDYIAKAVSGHDIVVNAIGPSNSEPSSILVEVANALVEGLKLADVDRLLVSGGAGSLEVSPGVRLVDTPDFPAGWKDVALAHCEALAIYQASSLDWTYLSPAAMIAPGERTGKFRTGTDGVLADEEGLSNISVEDFAIALVDEIEAPRFIRRQFTVAY